jgi:[ribosomal protein S18]-alanine N-acetyltransferase
MTSGRKFRIATLDDVAPLAALHAECFEDPWSAQSMIDVLGSTGAFGYVSDLPRTAGNGHAAIAGFVIARVTADDAELLSLGVAPSCRRRGLGRMLVSETLVRVMALGARRIFLEVAVDNHDAQALYATFGFATVGRRPDYYRNRDGSMTAALTLRRILDSAQRRHSGL